VLIPKLSVHLLLVDFNWNFVGENRSKWGWGLRCCGVLCSGA